MDEVNDFVSFDDDEKEEEVVPLWEEDEDDVAVAPSTMAANFEGKIERT